ncbi:MAG: hypothetical protein AAF292_14905 [Pseudomonadota bacterium]
MSGFLKSVFPVAILLSTPIIGAPAIADDLKEGAGVERLLGEWSSECDAWGTPANCRIVWSEGLHAEHLKISYAISNRDNGAAIFSGEGVYRNGGDSLDGFWADSGGAVHPLSASWGENSLTTHWGRAGGEQGRTVYRLGENGGLEVTDWVLRREGWAEFMKVSYVRTSQN